MRKKRLTKTQSISTRTLLDRWYSSYDRIGYEGELSIWGMPLSTINMSVIRDIYIDNLKEAAEQGDWFPEELEEKIKDANEMYNDIIDG